MSKILVAGASRLADAQNAELFDAVTSTFTLTGSMVVRRSGNTATVLQDGRVLIVGGVIVY